MVDPALFEEYVEEIDGWPGSTIESRENIGVSMHAIDFSLDWPNEAPAEKHPLRYGAVERSAVIFEDDRTVDEWELRLAPIQQADNGDEEAVIRRLESIFTPEVGYGVNVLLASDGDTWTPHAHPARGGPRRQPADDVLPDLRSLWDRYRDLVTSDPFGVVAR